ncbi:TIGR01906 family membrane protein [Anaerotalea alkaliphila]|uniref:TIGR01906 family membrane protein n=1 Tax=Anaerotalea alkaliphila TaxID=2662126 RepID=A0A7X5HVW2_9FIRM|nr:TIGR01906 family membrane protein [Anaerotalea alkaliphila]NDL67625.1 TIGR01906 family membrane protein [Anaerotalea alkaliphila]
MEIRICRWLNRVLLLWLLVALLFHAVQLVAFNMEYFSWHYRTYDIMADTGMAYPELMESTREMLSYLLGDREDLVMEVVVGGELQEVFGEREKAHMVDVRQLVLQGRGFRDLGTALFLFYSGLLFWKRRECFLLLLASVKRVFAGGILAMAVVGGLLAWNFERWFVLFHEVFFDNDLWLLDPATDVLINMVPEVFFFNTSMLILLAFLLEAVLLGAGAAVWSKRTETRQGR